MEIFKEDDLNDLKSPPLHHICNVIIEKYCPKVTT